MARSTTTTPFPRGDAILAVGVFGLIAVMLIPLPGWALDIFLASSIGASLLLFLAALTARRPVDLSTFPTLLLIATLYRLALNVASTRTILLHGSEGTDAAGHVIEAFGQFVVGGNAAVGFVVFAILVIINFVVITKGAGRVAEVAARFTLDAMPGKQMAVDAELNAGLIDEKVARARRSEIAREADFHGAMDGASKFVRGDAIAGIGITFVNAIGGVLIGVFQHDMEFAHAVETFLILTIGDGLAGQVPALIVSTAAGLLVTRVSDAENQGLADQVHSQFLNGPSILWLGAGVLGLFALIPGLTLPFAGISGALAWGGWKLHTQTTKPIAAPTDHKPAAEAQPEDLLGVEALAIEFSGDLLYLVDERTGGELLQRITKVRRQFAQELGLVLPPVNVRDDLALPPGTYRLLLRGEPLATGRLHPRQHLALDPGTAKGALAGVSTTDPVFGLAAYWIPAALVLKAQQCGYTVVDVPTVVTTHLVELMHIHGHELYDPGQLDKALERVSRNQPKLVEDLSPDPLPRISLLRVFRNLLREDLSVRDAQTILEALAEHTSRTKDPDLLTELVRQRLSRQISRRWAPEGTLACVNLGPALEEAVLRGLTAREGMAPVLALDPPTARQLIIRTRELTEAHSGATPAALLCPPLARGAIRRLVEKALPRVPVLSTAELVPTVRLLNVGTVDVDKALKAG